jgi:diguanylate cyclase
MKGSPQITTEQDREFSDFFCEIRRALENDQGPEAEWLLYMLERRVRDHFLEHQSQAIAVADANARAVEIIDRQLIINQELQRQNAELVKQKDLIDATRQELEEQSRAIANANVDAVLRLDEADDKIRSLDTIRQELDGRNLQLAEIMENLQKEAMALASANVEAVLLLDHKDITIQQFKKKSDEMEEIRKDLEDKVFLDPMTGLSNYRYFSRQMDLEIARARRYGRKLTMVFLDLDHFKCINDNYGHLFGDKVLAEIGKLIQKAVRSADIFLRLDVKPVTARYGGEEFVIILPETPLEGGRIVADRIRKAIQAAEFECGKCHPVVKITLSGGVAEFNPCEEAEEFIRRADSALYRAKEMGRNKIEVDTTVVTYNR